MTKLECGHSESPHSEFTTGYGTDINGDKYCYACCADEDRRLMREVGEWTGYLVGGTITNWPGSLKLPVTHVKHSHGYGFGTHYQVTTGNFNFEGHIWSFRNAGDMQIARCKRTKQTVH
jgi:hypothetical protein